MSRFPRPAALFAAALALGALAAPAPAAAQSGSLAWAPAAKDPPGPSAEALRSQVRLLPGWRTEAGGRVAGLRLALQPGWKTYWRVPGEAGIPPAFDWSGSENVADLRVRWPRPLAFESFGMTTLGYAHEVVLPLEITPEDPAAPVRLRLDFAYGVCSDICLPEAARLALDLPPQAEGGSGSIRAALAALPRPAAAAGAEMESCAIVTNGDDRRLDAVVRLPGRAGEAPLAVVEAPAPVWFEPAAARADGARVHVSARLDPATGDGWIDRSALRLTVIDGGDAIEFAGCAPDE
jgi:DsbC/DsbD-like thiol-disulfide interchange protein